MIEDIAKFNEIVDDIKAICNQYKGTKLYQTGIVIPCEAPDSDPRFDFCATLWMCGLSIHFDQNAPTRVSRLDILGNGELEVIVKQRLRLSADGTLLRNFDDNWSDNLIECLWSVLFALQENYDQKK